MARGPRNLRITFDADALSYWWGSLRTPIPPADWPAQPPLRGLCGSDSATTAIRSARRPAKRTTATGSPSSRSMEPARIEAPDHIKG